MTKQELHRARIEYYLAEGRSVSGGTQGKSGQQKVAEAGQNYDTGQQQALQSASNQTIGQFEGPVQQSPFYKSLLTTGIENTSNAFQNAQSAQNARANQAGFGYNQPVAQGANNQLQAKETSALAQVPQTAMAEAAPLSMQAGQIAGQEALGYGSQAQGWNQQASNLQNQRNQQKSQTIKDIGEDAALGAATVATGGAAAPLLGGALAGQTGGGDDGGFGFADGTDYSPAGPAVVGERGPEIVDLPQGSQVIPTDMIKRAALKAALMGV